MRTLITTILLLTLLTSCKKEEKTRPTTTIKGRVVSAITPEQFNSYDSLPFNILGLNWLTYKGTQFITVGNKSELPNPISADLEAIYVTRKPPQTWVVKNDSFVESIISNEGTFSNGLFQIDTLLYNGPITIAVYHSTLPWSIVPTEYIFKYIDLYPPYEYEFTTNAVYEWECEFIPGETCQTDYYGVAIYEPENIPNHRRRPWAGGVVSSSEEEVVKHGESSYFITEILLQ